MKGMIILPMSITLLTGCNYGEYDTWQEAIYEDVNEVHNILLKEEIEGYTVIVYEFTPESKADDLPKNLQTIGISFLSGSNEEGWRLEQSRWMYYKNDDLMMGSERFNKTDDQGNDVVNFYVSYGEVRNPKAKHVELLPRNRGEADYEEVKMLNGKGGRYYFKIGDYYKVRLLNEKKEVIHSQGG